MISKQSQHGLFRLYLILGLSAVLTFAFGSSVISHVDQTDDPYTFNDDARQFVAPFVVATTRESVGLDYISHYFLDCLPRGYWLVNYASSKVGDPRKVSRVLTYVIFAILVIAAGTAAWRLGGAASALCSLAFLFSSQAYLDSMGGALPRGFAYPLLALLILALLLDRPYWMATICLIGALFYYPVAVIAGLALAVYYVIPAAWRPNSAEASLARRATIVGLTGVCCVVLAIPGVIASAKYGEGICWRNNEPFPEAQAGGRLYSGDRPQPVSLASVVSYATETLRTEDNPWNQQVFDFSYKFRKPIFAIAILITAVGFCLRFRESTESKRIVVFGVAVVIGYALAVALAPRLFIPRRYLSYPAPLLVAILFPSSLITVLEYLKASTTTSRAVTVCTCALLMFLLGGRGFSERGCVHIPIEQRVIYERISQLPGDSLIAGWPTGIVENVPYLTGRTVLLSRETHQVYLADYTLEMRKRMNALIDAFLSEDRSALLALRNEFDVTHVVVNEEQVKQLDLTYFKPFDVAIKDAKQRLQGKTPAVLQCEDLVVWRYGDHALLDLNASQSLPEGSGASSSTNLSSLAH